MTTATLEKRVRALEAKMKVLEKTAHQPISIPVRTAHTATGKQIQAKKLPKWLEASLREAEEGKLIGPFRSVEDFMADLKR